MAVMILILLIFCSTDFSVAEKRVIYDSQDEFESGFTQWTKSNGNTPSYVITDGQLHGDCATNFVIKDTCYLYAPRINITHPSLLNVHVSFTMTSCSTLAEDKGVSDENLERCVVLLPLSYSTFDGDDDWEYFQYDLNETPGINTASFADREFINIDNISPSSYDEMNTRVYSMGDSPIEGEVVFRLEDDGACFALARFYVFEYFCPSHVENLIYFPQTNSKKSNEAVVGNCIGNSTLSSSSTPKKYCGGEGGWVGEPQEVCECDAGFYPNSDLGSCIPCKFGQYKSSIGNSACEECPGKSSAVGIGSLLCDCDEGFSRGPSDPVSSSCIIPITSAVSNVEIERYDEFAVLKWEPVSNPNSAEDPVLYIIDCECYSFSEPRRPPVETILNRAVVDKLTPDALYKCDVFARNRATSPADISKTSHSFQTHPASKVSDLQRSPSELNETHTILSWNSLAESGNWLEGHAIAGFNVQGRDARRSIVASAFVTDSQADLNQLFPSLGDMKNITFSVAIVYQIGEERLNSSFYFSESMTESSLPDDPHDGSLGGVMKMLPVHYLAAVACAFFVLLFLVILIALLLAFQHRRNRLRQKNEGDMYLMRDVSPAGGYDPLNDNQYEEIDNFLEACGGTADYNVNPRDLAYQRLIGQGRFASVHRFVYQRHEAAGYTFVAVKEPLEGNDDLEKEAEVLKQIKHRNIVRLIGLTQEPPGVRRRIVMEYMESGALDKFLTGNKGAFSPTELLCMLLDVASAMQYLHQAQFVHRDLACRNILVGAKQACKLNPSVGEEVPICKLSDFGLCRAVEANSDFYAMKSGGVFPVRWTAPECVESQHSTRAGDVWSFAIVMWEVFTFGERPYWGWANQCVYKAVGDGYRLPPPTNCPTNVYREVMGDCWHGNPDQRLDFDQIVSKLTYFITSQDSTVDPLDSSNFNPFNEEAKKMVLRSGNSVEVWLQNLKLSQHWPKFQDRNLTLLSQLTETTYSDLRDSFGIELVGHRRKLIQSIEVIRKVMSSPKESTGGSSSGFSSSVRPRDSVASISALSSNGQPRSSWCSSSAAATNETLA